MHLQYNAMLGYRQDILAHVDKSVYMRRMLRNSSSRLILPSLFLGALSSRKDLCLHNCPVFLLDTQSIAQSANLCNEVRIQAFVLTLPPKQLTISLLRDSYTKSSMIK